MAAISSRFVRSAVTTPVSATGANLTAEERGRPRCPLKAAAFLGPGSFAAKRASRGFRWYMAGLPQSACRYAHAVADPGRDLIKAPELMHRVREGCRPRTSLVEEFSEPTHRTMSAGALPDHAGDNLTVEF